MLDIAILIMPKVDPYAPTVGPSVLKSHLIANGFTCTVLDLNIDLYNYMSESDRQTYYFTTADSVFELPNEYDIDEKTAKFIESYSSWFDDVVGNLRKLNPRFVGMSLLTQYSRTFSYHLSKLIKKRLPHIKIIWGGANVNRYTDDVIKKNAIDYYIFGDGEFVLVELLKGNLDTNGINSLVPQQVEDLSTVMIPDYSDIKWDNYLELYPNANLVYITGSRGCVKRCTFCDIHTMWPKYKYRTSKSIFKEIIELRQKWDRRDFHFTDSLINGSMKTFKELMVMLKDYRMVDTNFKWRSQWIMRPQNQCTADDYALMKASGCAGLEVGLESFSESVRFHMGKKIKDADMWFCLEQLQKHRIQHSLLMIVGYPTETEEDHQKSLDTIKLLHKKGFLTTTTSDDSKHPLLHFGYGNTLMLDRDSKLYDDLKDDLVYYNTTMDWQYKDNTPEVRLRRMQEIWDLINNIRGNDKFMEKMVASHIKGFDS